MPVPPTGQTLAERLLNEGQRGFPLSDRPFAQMGKALGATENEVIDTCVRLAERGAISRIGGVWAPGVGGAALLCAIGGAVWAGLTWWLNERIYRSLSIDRNA